MDPSKRFPTLVMAAGVVVLLIAIVFGERMGDRVFVRENASNGSGLETMPVITPIPAPTTVPYGPNWKDSQTLAAAPDPGFPDPRIPPKALPTATPRPTPSPTPRWTPNPNIPIWDQTPPPSPGASPSTAPVRPSASESASPSPSSAPSPAPATAAAVEGATPTP